MERRYEDEDEELEYFLKQIDKVDSKVKKLASKDGADSDSNDSDSTEQTTASKPKSRDRTVINKWGDSSRTPKPTTTTTPSSTGSSQPAGGQQMMGPDAAAFMSALEADAAERAERRRRGRERATQLKDEGNVLFRTGSFQAAFDKYTEALEASRDFDLLYTNRALACMKLERYQDALNDCDWALRLNENNAKALTCSARAHLALHEYDKARAFCQRLLAADPKMHKSHDDLLAEVNLAERAAAEVLDARANTAKPADSGQGSGPGTGPGLSPKGTSPSPSPSGEPKSKSTSTSWTGLSLADVLARLRRPRAQLVQAIGGETGAGSGAKEGAGPAAAQSTDTLLLHYLLGGLEILHPLLSSDEERIKWRQLQGSKLFADPNSEIFRYLQSDASSTPAPAPTPAATETGSPIESQSHALLRLADASFRTLAAACRDSDTNRLDLVEEKSLLALLPKYFRKSTHSVEVFSSLTENPVITRKLLQSLDSKEILEKLLQLVVEDRPFGTTCSQVFNAFHNLLLEDRVRQKMDVGLVPQVVAALQVVTSRAQSVLEKRETPLLPPRVSPLEVAERGLIVATNLCLEQPLRARLATDSAFVSSLVDLLSKLNVKRAAQMPEDEQKLTSAVFGLLYNLSLEGAAAIDVRRAVPLACAILAAHSPGPEPSPGASATPTRDAATSASGSSTTSSISGTISERALGLLARLLARQSTAAEIASDKKTRTLLVRTTLACCEALLAALSRLTENANVSGDALLLASGFEREETLLKRARALVRCILFIVKSSKELHANTKACDVLLVGLHASDVQLAGNAALALRELLDEKSASSRICAHLHDEAHVVPLLSAAGAGQAHSCNVGSLLAGCAKRDQRVTLLLHKLRALGALRDAGKSAVSSSN